MKSILLFSFCCLSAILSAQDLVTPNTITILGKYTKVVDAIGYGLNIEFDENSSKCDPVKGYLTLETKIIEFEEAAKKKGISLAQMKSVVTPNNTTAFERKKRFEIVQPTRELMDAVIAICSEQEVKIVDDYYVLPPYDLAAEDESAIGALQNATARAENLAKQLGKRIVNIISIDDDPSPGQGRGTSDDLSFFNVPLSSQSAGYQFFAYMEDHFFLDQNSREYVLLVTYLIE